MPSFILVVKHSLALILNNLDDSSRRMREMQLDLLRYDNLRRKHAPMKWLFVVLSFPDLIFNTGELVQLRLEDISRKQKPPHSGLHNQPIIKHLPGLDGLSLQQAKQVHLFDLCSMRVDDPYIPLLKYSQKILILDKLKDHDKVPLVHAFRRVGQSDPLQDVSFIREDEDIFEGGVIFSDRQNLGLV